ncbi:MAG: glycosyltransferase family 4 protein, partial [Panacagrimonas sp.]
LRQGRICTECLDRRSARPAIAHGCYRGRIASVPVAFTIAWHRHARTWNRAPHALIVLTGFQKTMMAKAGLAEDRLHVKGNFTPDAEPIAWSERDPTVVFLGRVSEEKGIRMLIDAWQILGARAPRLRIIGAGDGLANLRARIASSGMAERIDVVGTLPHAEAMHALARARLLVFPSIWYEPFGMSIIEAYARAVPVAASRVGSLPDLVHEGRTGILFAPGDAQTLADRVAALWNDQGELERMGLEARREWAQNHGAEENLRRLESVYREAQAVRAVQGRPMAPAVREH